MLLHHRQDRELLTHAMEINNMKTTDYALILMALILFVAIVHLSNYEAIEESYRAPQTPLDNLTTFLEDDTTSDGVYYWDDYHCVHFSVDLVDNLTVAGYNATPVVLATARPGLWSHMVVSVNLDNETVYIEPQTDEVFSPSRWDLNASLGDEVVRVNISTARSMIV